MVNKSIDGQMEVRGAFLFFFLMLQQFMQGLAFERSQGDYLNKQYLRFFTKTLISAWVRALYVV